MTHVLRVRNVCQALPAGMSYLLEHGRREQSRAGPVIVAPSPVVTVTEWPTERVLFSPVRDSNPFFVLYESVYLLGVWRDRPCSNIIMLRVRPPERHAGRDGEEVIEGPRLDLTVCCRSNDMLFGCQHVHFSVLQEYLAARIGVGVGEMTQFSFNYYIYQDKLDLLRKRAEGHPYDDGVSTFDWCLRDDRYVTGGGLIVAHPMFTAPDAIDEDVRRFAQWHDALQTENEASTPRYANEWFLRTLTPAMLAHQYHKEKQTTAAMSCAHTIAAPDWRVACEEWIGRRQQ